MKIRADTQTFDIFDEQWAWLFQPETFDDDRPVWSESDILQLFEFLLRDSIAKLNDPRLSPRTQMEITLWIKDESDPHPFSFDNCCRICGLDAEFMRESVLYKTRHLRRTLH